MFIFTCNNHMCLLLCIGCWFLRVILVKFDWDSSVFISLWVFLFIFSICVRKGAYCVMNDRVIRSDPTLSCSHRVSGIFGIISFPIEPTSFNYILYFNVWLWLFFTISYKSSVFDFFPSKKEKKKRFVWFHLEFLKGPNLFINLVKPTN